MDIDRVKLVVGQMTLKEKVQFLGCGVGLKTVALNRLKIYSMALADDLLYYKPILSALGCTFDRELMSVYGSISKYHSAEKSLSMDGVINLGVIREPMEEGAGHMLGEDAFLVSELAKAFIDGAGTVIGTNIASGEKAFADRYMDSRALKELYLKPFIDVAKSLGGAVIPSGCLNGEIMSESKEFVAEIVSSLSENAIIINEAGSIIDKVKTLSTDCCFEIGQSSSKDKQLIKLVEDGKLSEKRIDNCIERNIMYFAEHYEKAKKEGKPVKSQIEFDKRVSSESIVMLKNDGVLPLSASNTLFSFCGNVDPEIISVMSSTIKCNITKTGKDGDVVCILAKAENGEFPSSATKLIDASISAGKKTVLFIQSPTPLELPDVVGVNAIFYVPCVYFSTYTAIAEILCGAVNPSGKLNVSWAFKPSDYPAQKNARAYSRGMYCYESVLNGYKYFSTFNAPVRYCFGHGLSYSNFEYTKFKADVIDDVINIEFVVKNNSKIMGSTVAMIFADLPDSSSILGIKTRLIGFARIELDPGENTLVKINKDVDSLVLFDERDNVWIAPGGKYTIKVCESVDNVKASDTVKMPRSSRLDFGLNKKKVSSYYVESNFNPTGTDIEKVVRQPLLQSSNKNENYLLRPDEQEQAKFDKALTKKIRKATKEKDLTCAFTGVSYHGYKKLNDADM